METPAAQTTLTGALALSGPGLIAFVGAGGKSAALQALARELTTGGAVVVATTTTRMFAAQLSALGPLVLAGDDPTPLAARVGRALRGAGIVSVAESVTPDGKVRGLAPATVDALWTEHPAGTLVVEADGSRGLPLKAFGADEPQLPARTTAVVVLAGLDAVGLPLDDEHVHRAGLLASGLGVAPGSLVTPRLLGAAVARQVERVRETVPDARITVLLNKADNEQRARLAAEAAETLLRISPSGRGAALPQRIVVGSVSRSTYTVVHGETPGAPRVLGVVLAAGTASRMGGSKVVLPVGGRPMVARVVDAALASRLSGTVVVVGNEAGAVRRVLAGRPVRLVDNPAFAEGLSTSVQAALRSAGSGFDAALFLLADQPFVTAALLDRLLDEHVATGSLIVRPESGGRPANPVLFSARLFPELLRETGDRGGREVARRHAADVRLVPVDDPLVCLDVDSPDDYERSRGG